MKILCRPKNHIFALFGPLYLENSKRWKKSAETILKALTERNPMNKIPSKWDEKWKFYVGPKIAYLAVWAPCISKTVKDRKKSVVILLKALIERNLMKKIPSKWDEKWKFYLGPKITFLAPLALCLTKAAGDRKNRLKALFERNPMKKIPSKLDEKWKFYVAPKIAFLAPLAPFISKNRKICWHTILLQALSERNLMKKIPLK